MESQEEKRVGSHSKPASLWMLEQAQPGKFEQSLGSTLGFLYGLWLSIWIGASSALALLGELYSGIRRLQLGGRRPDRHSQH
jgi:hypothetical protein